MKALSGLQGREPCVPHPGENQGLAEAVQSFFSLIINSQNPFHEIKLPCKGNFFIVLGALLFLTRLY